MPYEGQFVYGDEEEERREESVPLQPPAEEPAWASPNRPSYQRTQEAPGAVTDWNINTNLFAPLDLWNAWLGERMDYLRTGDPIEPVAPKVFRNPDETEEPTYLSRELGDIVRGDTAPEVNLLDAIMSPWHYGRILGGGAVEAAGDVLSGDVMGGVRGWGDTLGETASFARGHAAFTVELATELATDPLIWIVPLSRVARTGTATVKKLLPRVMERPGALIEEMVGPEAASRFRKMATNQLDQVFSRHSSDELLQAGDDVVDAVRMGIRDSAMRVGVTEREALDIIEAEALGSLNFEVAPRWRYFGRNVQPWNRYRSVAQRVGDDDLLRGAARMNFGDVAGTRYTSRVTQTRKYYANRGKTPTTQEIMEYVGKFADDAGAPADNLADLMALELKHWRPTEISTVGSVMPGVGQQPMTAGMYRDLGYLEGVGEAVARELGIIVDMSRVDRLLRMADETVASRAATRRMAERQVAEATSESAASRHARAAIRSHRQAVGRETAALMEEREALNQGLQQAYPELARQAQERMGDLEQMRQMGYQELPTELPEGMYARGEVPVSRPQDLSEPFRMDVDLRQRMDAAMRGEEVLPEELPEGAFARGSVPMATGQEPLREAFPMEGARERGQQVVGQRQAELEALRGAPYRGPEGEAVAEEAAPGPVEPTNTHQEIVMMSQEQFAANPPEGFTWAPNKTNEASRRSDVEGPPITEIGPKFFELSPESRAQVLEHEVGHDLSDEMLSDGEAWDLVDSGALANSLWQGDYEGTRFYGGTGTPGEAIAEAYADYIEQPDFLRENNPELYAAIERRVKPTPEAAPEAPAAAETAPQEARGVEGPEEVAEAPAAEAPAEPQAEAETRRPADVILDERRPITEKIDQIDQRVSEQVEQYDPVAKDDLGYADEWREQGHLVIDTPVGTYRFAKSRAPSEEQIAEWEELGRQRNALREQEEALRTELNEVREAERQEELSRALPGAEKAPEPGLVQITRKLGGTAATSDHAHDAALGDAIDGISMEQQRDEIRRVDDAIASSEGRALGFRDGPLGILVPSPPEVREAARMRWAAADDPATQVDELKWIADANAYLLSQAAEAIGMPEDYAERLLTSRIARDLGFRYRFGGPAPDDEGYTTYPEDPNWPTAEQAALQGDLFDQPEAEGPDRPTRRLQREGPGAEVYDPTAATRDYIANTVHRISEVEQGIELNEEIIEALAKAEPELAAAMTEGEAEARILSRQERAERWLEDKWDLMRSLKTYWPGFTATDTHAMKTIVDRRADVAQRVRSWGRHLFGRLPERKRMAVMHLMAMKDHELRADLNLGDDLTVPAGTTIEYSDVDWTEFIWEVLRSWGEVDQEPALEQIAEGYEALPESGQEMWDVAEAGLDYMYELYTGETRDGERIFGIRGVRQLWDDLNRWSGNAYEGPSRGFIENYFPKPRVFANIPEYLLAERGVLMSMGMDPDTVDEMMERIQQFRANASTEFKATYERLGPRLVAMGAEMRDADEITDEAAYLMTEMDPLTGVDWYSNQVGRINLLHDIYQFVLDRFPNAEEIVAERGEEALAKLQQAGFVPLTIAGEPLPGLETNLMPPEYAHTLEARLLGQRGTSEYVGNQLWRLARTFRGLWTVPQVAVLLTLKFITANLMEYVARLTMQGIYPSKEWMESSAIAGRVFNRALINNAKVLPRRPLNPKRTAAVTATLSAVGATAGAALSGDPLLIGVLAGAGAVTGAAAPLTNKVHRVLAYMGEDIAKKFISMGADERKINRYVEEAIRNVVVTAGFGAQSTEQLTHVLPDVPITFEDLSIMASNRMALRGAARSVVQDIGHQLDLSRDELRDLTEAASLLFFGWDNLHRLTAYVTHRERGETEESARRFIRENTAEYTTGASTPLLEFLKTFVWYPTFMLQTGGQVARKAAQYPGVTLAAINLYRKRGRLMGIDPELEGLYSGKSWWKQTAHEWIAMPWNTLLVPENTAPGPTIQEEFGPGILDVRLRIPFIEEVGVWEDLVHDPWQWTKEKLVPGAQMMIEASERRGKYNTLQETPVVGTMKRLQRQVPGDPTDLRSPIARLGRGEQVSDEDLWRYIDRQATQAAVQRIEQIDGSKRQTAWANFRRQRSVPYECQARRVMWRDNPDRAEQFEREMMRMWYNVNLAERRTGLSMDVEFYDDLLKNMTLDRLTQNKAIAERKLENGEQPWVMPEIYQEEIDDRTRLDPNTGEPLTRRPITHWDQVDSVPLKILEGASQ